MIRCIAIVAIMYLLGCQAEAATRIKDITFVQGVRANQLVGYGLVIGLNGTGDTLRNSPFTQQSLQSMLDRMGINVRNANMRTRNIAAVIVTADLPPFGGSGAVGGRELCGGRQGRNPDARHPHHRSHSQRRPRRARGSR
jgi:flagellar P-ring protein FlgI